MLSQGLFRPEIYRDVAISGAQNMRIDVDGYRFFWSIFVLDLVYDGFFDYRLLSSVTTRTATLRPSFFTPLAPSSLLFGPGLRCALGNRGGF